MSCSVEGNGTNAPGAWGTYAVSGTGPMRGEPSVLDHGVGASHCCQIRGPPSAAPWTVACPIPLWGVVGSGRPTVPAAATVGGDVRAPAAEIRGGSCGASAARTLEAQAWQPTPAASAATPAPSESSR